MSWANSFNVLGRFDAENVEVWTKKSTAKTYIFSCFKLVPSKHPNLYARLLQVFYCLWNLILELIFHRRGSQHKESIFEFIVDHV